MNSFIVIDSQKCIGCHTCEVVCAVTHTNEKKGNDFLDKQNFRPRIRIIKMMNAYTASVCHQCEDSPCATACPVSALTRGEYSVEAHPENCIGCRACVMVCPFGAIEIKRNGIVLKSSALDIRQKEGLEIIKCDLCSHREQGSACVEFCPTNALACVTETELTAIVNQRRERSMERDFH